MVRLIFFFTMFGFLSSEASPLEVGATAPAPVVLNSEGESVELSQVYAAGPTLVYFYPKADTPGCTAQACNLRDSFESLTASGIQVVGVSTDGVKAQAAFKAKYSLPFMLVADQDEVLVKAFGVPTKMTFASRQSFLLVDGKVVWRDLKATPKTQSEDALAALKSVQ
ncbi:MAG: peroxiredoxin [Puniceicoccales bacterium]